MKTLDVFDEHRLLHKRGVGRGKLCLRKSAVLEPRRLNTLAFEDNQRRGSSIRGVEGGDDCSVMVSRELERLVSAINNFSDLFRQQLTLPWYLVA